MVSGVFGMFFIHRKRTASLPLSETAPSFLSLLFLYGAMSSTTTTELFPNVSIIVFKNTSSPLFVFIAAVCGIA